MPDANIKRSDQSAHQCSLISAFAVCFVDSIKPILAKFKLSILELASVAEQADLSLTRLQITKTGFLVTWLK